MRDVLPEGVEIEDVYRQFNDHGRAYGLDFKVNEFLPNSRKALEATEFAREQGEFEAFHGLVFQRYFTDGKDIGDVAVLLGIAGELGLDREVLRRALDTGVYTSVVEANRRRAKDAGVVLLPTFFIGDERIMGIKDYAHYQKICARFPAD